MRSQNIEDWKILQLLMFSPKSRKCVIFATATFFILLSSLSTIKAQSAYRGGKGDGYASNRVKGVSINGAKPQTFKLKIYPNPLFSGGALKISFPESVNENVQIKLVDVLGRICYFEESDIKQNIYSLNLPQLSYGTYFIYIKTEKEELKEKLIIIKNH